MAKAPFEQRIASFCARRALLNQWLSRFCRYYMDIGTNFSYDIESNGEAWLIHAAAALNPRVMLDVGANVGDWTLRAARQFPLAKIFSFEPNLAIYDRLVQNTAKLTNVGCVNAAIAPSPGSFPLFVRTGEEHIGVSSLTKYAHHDASVTVSVINGDSWLEESGIECIDFLKIDVEGNELGVLKAFSKAIERQAVRLAQFEFAVVNPIDRIFLKDIYDLVEPSGYSIGRLYPNFVLFKPYEIRDEWWKGPNYVICRSGETALRETLENRGARDFYMEYVTMK